MTASEQFPLVRTDAEADGRIYLVGELDLSTVDTLRERLEAAAGNEPGDIDIDMSGVTFCDSSGLKVLLTAHHDMLGQGRRLRLVGLRDGVRRLLEISGTTTLLTSG